MSVSTSLVGNKEINAMNLIRMGLAKAKTTGVINLAKYKSNWEMLSDKEMKPLYDKVMGFLVNQRPYGEFFAIREIFGEEMAKMVAKRGEVIAPPGGLLDNGPPKSGKMTHDMDMDIDQADRDFIELSDD